MIGMLGLKTRVQDCWLLGPVVWLLSGISGALMSGVCLVSPYTGAYNRAKKTTDGAVAGTPPSERCRQNFVGGSGTGTVGRLGGPVTRSVWRRPPGEWLTLC